jgi:hypothetical protein
MRAKAWKTFPADAGKVLEMARLPGLLVNPSSPTFSNLVVKDISAAAAAIEKKVEV